MINQEKSLNLAFEIEGLLLLLRERGGEEPMDANDMATEDIERLLRDKVRELADSVNCSLPEPDITSETEKAEAKAILFEEAAEAEEDAPEAEEETPEAEEETPEAEEDTPEAEEQAEIDAELDTAEFDTEAEAEAEEFEEEAEAQPAEAAVTEPDEDFGLFGLKPDVKSAEPTPARRPNLVFTLNDRFRFRRELFSNSDSEMADAINTIGSMHSYDEAEEYFYTDLNWDPENPDVADFMEIIRNSFK